MGGGGNKLSLFQEKPSSLLEEYDDVKFWSLMKRVSAVLSNNSVSTDIDPDSENLGMKRKLEVEDDPLVYNPMPLRWYMPEGGEIYNLGLKKMKKMKKMKKNKKPRRNRNDDVIAVPSIEEFPELMQAIESLIGGIGSRPFFSYSKKLEVSDVNKKKNRVFLTNGEDEVVSFLNATEKAAIESEEGLKIVGVDQRGNKYYNLKMQTWPSLNMKVIKSDWNKMFAANNANEGDLLHIWGFRRRNGELALAVVFRKQ